MKIKLLGWESRGLRCPDVKVDLTAGTEPAQVSLIQMPNGTGKTTTLMLLEGTMSGAAVRWSEEEIRRLRRPDETNREGIFVVRLGVDGRALTFELAFDFEQGRIQCRTTRAGSGGITSGWDPQPAVRRFLNEKFLNLFIFDGEFANRLFEASGHEAEAAIEALCQLYLLEEVETFAEGIWNRKAKQSDGKSDATLARFERTRDQLMARRDEVVEKRDRSVKQSANLQAQIEILDRKIEARLAEVESTRDQAQEAKLALLKAKNDLDRITTQTITALRNPLALNASFAETLWSLKSNLDTLRLPENTSRQFFNELLEQDECICGREMTEGAATEIKARAELVLDDVASGFLNVLKQDVEQAGAPEESAPLRQAFGESIADLAAARRQRREAQQTAEQLQRQLVDAGDDELKSWQEDRRKAGSLLEGAQMLLGQINAPDDGEDDLTTWSLASLDRQLTAVRGKIAVITATLVLRAQTDVLLRILERVGELARAEIKSDLIEVCNDRLREVLVNDPLRIASIDGALRLAGQSGASVGQTLSVGYVFLMSVLQRGGNELPLIVDSPANPIDAGVRRRIGALIPKLCSQFVGFTINTEREGFVPALQAEASEVKYLTLFRQTPGTTRMMARLPSTGVTTTENSVLVEDRAFFESFDLQDEEV